MVATSIGLTRSGLRRTLPRPIRIGSTVVVSALSLATLLALVVLPYFSLAPARHDQSVTFAGTAPTAAPATAATSAPTLAVPATAAPAPASAPATGTFNHQAGPDTVSGSATLGKTQAGSNVLRITGLDATPGPDLYVYLSRVESPNGLQSTAGLLVSQLKSSKGDFTFTLDPALDLSQFRSVVVYCRSFNIVFGYANLK